MVDFYEGDWEKYSYPTELVNYYKQLNIASNGRFLPLVSFSPERSYEEEVVARWDREETYKRNLELVKYAIEELGFIGVKLHPSSGFSPINNNDYGCPNTPNQRQERLFPAQAAHYDKILMELFEYCRRVDVPLLIHSGTGISANRECMERGDDPSKWTNSPNSWSQALDIVNGVKLKYEGRLIPEDQELRICLAHFAGAFRRGGKPMKMGSAFDHTDPYKYPEAHPWLLLAAEACAKHKGVYVDLADVSEWFSDDTPGEYNRLFLDFIDGNDDLAQKMMYGTDWHMPEVAPLGSRYLSSVQDFLPPELMDNTMGLNAVEFYGLARGRATRKRLEAFYSRHDLDLKKIPWIAKIDNPYL